MSSSNFAVLRVFQRKYVVILVTVSGGIRLSSLELIHESYMRSVYSSAEAPRLFADTCLNKRGMIIFVI